MQEAKEPNVVHVLKDPSTEKLVLVPEDPSAYRFVRTMEIIATIGLAIVLIAGIAYLVGINNCVSPQTVVANWHLPASEFWQTTNHVEASGYAWFLGHLECAANICILGIAIMMLAPLMSILAALPTTRGIYLFFYLTLTAEFLFTILKPILAQLMRR